MKKPRFTEQQITGGPCVLPMTVSCCPSRRLRAPARVQHHAQHAVDAEPGMSEAGVGWAHTPTPGTSAIGCTQLQDHST